MENETKHIWAQMLDFRSRALRALWQPYGGHPSKMDEKSKSSNFRAKKCSYSSLLVDFDGGLRKIKWPSDDSEFFSSEIAQNRPVVLYLFFRPPWAG